MLSLPFKVEDDSLSSIMPRLLSATKRNSLKQENRRASNSKFRSKILTTNLYMPFTHAERDNPFIELRRESVKESVKE